MTDLAFTWLFEVLPVAMIVIDRDDRVTMVNPAWEARSGRMTLVGSDALSMFATDSHQAIAALRTGQDGITARFTHTITSVRLRGVSLPDGAGLLLLIDDGAELAMLQTAQAHSLRLQAIGQLAAGIAHDFNNLLASILGSADAITERCSTDLETVGDAANIRASGERGAAMVRQLLALGGQQTLLPRPVATNPAIHSLAEMARRLLPASIVLDVSLEAPGRAILIDPNELDRLLLNLIVNARDALVDGGRITLTTGHAILLEPMPELPDHVPPGRYVTVTVSDNGRGMDRTLQSRVFEPFFTTRRDQGGSGLGLATVLGIVHQSGGYLTLRSAPDEGACFRLYFPRHAMPHDQAASSDPGHPCDRIRRVLLVDDEDILRKLATKVLARRGWDVLAADCAEAALSMLDGVPIAAIITDVMMPGMDGTALVQAVRTKLGQPDLPAILVSGYADPGLRTHVTDTASLFLTKPYKMTDLGNHLDNLMRQGNQRTATQ